MSRMYYLYKIEWLSVEEKHDKNTLNYILCHL